MPRRPYERSPPRRRRSPPEKSRERVQASRQSYFCEFCKAQLTTEKLYKDHCESAVHKQKEMMLKKAVTDGLHFCYTCDRIFPTKVELDAHCLLSRHHPLYRAEEVQHLVKLWQKGEDVQPKEEPPKEVPTDTRRARETRERNEIVLKLSQLREGGKGGVVDGQSAIESVREDPIRRDCYCSVCELDCLNASNFKIHIESWKHRAVLDRKREEGMDVTPVQAEKPPPTTAVQNPPALASQPQQQPPRQPSSNEDDREDEDATGSGIQVPSNLREKSEFFCDVCRVPLETEQDYYEHCGMRRHLRMVSHLKRPFRCYLCDMIFNMENEFNYHLHSMAHVKNMIRAANRDVKPPVAENEGDDWVEKRDKRGPPVDMFREPSRDKSKEVRRSRSRDRDWDKSNENEGRKRAPGIGRPDRGSEDLSRKDEDHRADQRKVEIVESNIADPDLRHKLQGKNIIITKQSSPDIKLEDKGPSGVAGKSLLDERDDYDKKAQDLELQAKFKKLAKEYEGNLPALKEKLTKEREIDIMAYQQYELKYKRLCEEEDSIREELRVMAEDNPKKEGLIRNMIRIQRDMREVRGELEFREMMIIKREGLFREKFPNSSDTQVVIQPLAAEKQVQSSQNAGVADPLRAQPIATSGNAPIFPVLPYPATPLPSKVGLNPSSGGQDDDLRIQLERERLLKRLGPELNSIDASIRDKLLSAIFDDDSAGKHAESSRLFPAGDERLVVQSSESSNSRQMVMEKLMEREKQLVVELAELRKKPPAQEKLKPTKSLVPQYDDLEEKGKLDKAKKSRGRSHSSASSDTSSGSSGDYKPRRKRKKSPAVSKSRGKSRKEDHSRKRRKSRSPAKPRRSSRDQKKKKASISKEEEDGDDWKVLIKKGDASEERKSSKPSKGRASSESKSVGVEKLLTKEEVSQPSSIIPVLGGVSTTTVSSLPTAPPIKKPKSTLEVRKEQFALWKNPAPKESPDSPKEDVWDIAFTGGQAKDSAADDAVSLFNPSNNAPAQLPADIWNILRSVSSQVSQSAALASSVSSAPSVTVASQKPIGTSTVAVPRPLASGTVVGTSSSASVAVAAISATGAPENNFNQDAGGRVRSILKKMKEFPGSHLLQEAPLNTRESPPVGPGVIPGLDGDLLASNDPSLAGSTPYQESRILLHQRAELGPVSGLVQQGSSHQISAGSSMPRMAAGQVEFPQNPVQMFNSLVSAGNPPFAEQAYPPSAPGLASMAPLGVDGARAVDVLRERSAGYPEGQGVRSAVDPQPLRADDIAIQAEMKYLGGHVALRRDEHAGLLNSSMRSLDPHFDAYPSAVGRPAAPSYAYESSRLGLDPLRAEGMPGLGPLPEQDRLQADRSYALRLEERDALRRLDGGIPRALNPRDAAFAPRVVDPRDAGFARTLLPGDVSRAPDPRDVSLPRTLDPRETALLERRVYAADLVPPRRGDDLDLIDRPPVRQPGESEESFYNRFERYYELKRRKEVADRLRLEREREILRRVEEERRAALEREEILRCLERERLSREQFERERIRLDRLREEEARIRDAEKRRRQSLIDGRDNAHRRREDETEKRDSGSKGRRGRSRERDSIRDDRSRNTRSRESREESSGSKESGDRRGGSLSKSDKDNQAEGSSSASAEVRKEECPGPGRPSQSGKRSAADLDNRNEDDWRLRNMPAEDSLPPTKKITGDEAATIASKQPSVSERPTSANPMQSMNLPNARMERDEDPLSEGLRSGFPGRNQFSGQRDVKTDALGYSSIAPERSIHRQVDEAPSSIFPDARERVHALDVPPVKKPVDPYAPRPQASSSASPQAAIGPRVAQPVLREMDLHPDVRDQFAKEARIVQPHLSGPRQLPPDASVPRRDPRMAYSGDYEDARVEQPLAVPRVQDVSTGELGGSDHRAGYEPETANEGPHADEGYGDGYEVQYSEWDDPGYQDEHSSIEPSAYSDSRVVGRDPRQALPRHQQELENPPPSSRKPVDPRFGPRQPGDPRYSNQDVRDPGWGRGLESRGGPRVRPQPVHIREERPLGGVRYPYRSETRPPQPGAGRGNHRYQAPY